jgi:hypothetical protein
MAVKTLSFSLYHSVPKHKTKDADVYGNVTILHLFRNSYLSSDWPDDAWVFIFHFYNIDGKMTRKLWKYHKRPILFKSSST